MAKEKQQKVSEAEVQHAIQKFLEQGGLIKRLPDEVTPANSKVGGRHAAYESVVEHGDGGSAA